MQPQWRKSTRSEHQGNCAEARALRGAVGLRDSKRPGDPHLHLTPQAWRGLLTQIKAGQHDL
jgi:hypothetical protein